MKINIKDNVEKYDGMILPLYEDHLATTVLSLPLDELQGSKKFEGKINSTYKLTAVVEGQLKEVVLVGLGKKADLSYKKLLNAFANAYRLMKKQKVEKVILHIENLENEETLAKAATEAVLMADYKFDLKTKEKEDKEVSLDLITSVDIEVINESYVLAESNLIARDLVNQPSNIMLPIALADKTVELGKEKGFEVEVLDYDQIKELNMEAFISVAKASDNDPRFIIMRYKGDPESDEVLGYVGKGLTYDSGGLSIKPTASMAFMKSDMAGSAAVIGAMCAIADMKLKKNVTAVVAACENMISGKAYRPGDVIGSMGGKTIYIGNTDAEGRLTLIDAMHYIVTKENVSKVLDIATLTGAAIYCTGEAASPVISNNDEFYNQVQESFDLSGEQIWRMPIFDEYKEMIKHEEADLTNTAGNPGTITAGLFIGEFNGDLPWVHVDIAGTSFSKKEAGILSKGGTGVAVRPLYYLAKN
jgi:leucyl aminopeptidase